MILWILVCAFILWIFSNSLENGASSGNLSEKVAAWLIHAVNSTGFSIAFDQFHFYVRKAAHFSEYALLGFLTVLAIHNGPLFRPVFCNFLLFWLLPPLMDEGIQHFVPGRYGALSDSLIDMSGFLAGSFLMYVLILIVLDLKKRMH